MLNLLPIKNIKAKEIMYGLKVFWVSSTKLEWLSIHFAQVFLKNTQGKKTYLLKGHIIHHVNMKDRTKNGQRTIADKFNGCKTSRKN